jgi:hypothetical protein
MGEMQTCYSLRCGYVTDAEGTKCPKCGGRLRTTKTIRRLGWAQLLIGLLLVGMMVTIIVVTAPYLLHPGQTSGGTTFTGTAEQSQLFLGLFAIVTFFGLGTMFSGGWQIATGRRNRWIAILMLIILVILVGVGIAVKDSVGK